MEREKEGISVRRNAFIHRKRNAAQLMNYVHPNLLYVKKKWKNGIKKKTEEEENEIIKKKEKKIKIIKN
jgi:hypothetical protein